MAKKYDDIICMVREDGKRDVFLAAKDRMPKDPIGELKAFFSERMYINGCFLADKNKVTYKQIKNMWLSYDSSLMGIWHHPHFPENFEEMKRNSGFLFDVPNWCHAELKDTTIVDSCLE